jgi:hypothetical protein
MQNDRNQDNASDSSSKQKSPFSVTPNFSGKYGRKYLRILDAALLNTIFLNLSLFRGGFE